MLKRFWKNYGTQIIIFITIAGLLLFSMNRVGKNGTYTSFDQYKKYLNYLPRKKQEETRVKSKGDSKPELLCRDVLESYFNMPFSKARPDFLRNPVTGNKHNLELDCYNPNLRLAVEYNGAQHYKYIPFFHRNYDAFTNQKYRDELKRRICADNGITVLEVPYTVKYSNIPAFIMGNLNKLGY